MLDIEPYVCPCAACIAGLRLQLRGLPEGEDDPWLRGSLALSRERRAGDSRYANKDERGVFIPLVK
jgi:hypothetical protein